MIAMLIDKIFTGDKVEGVECFERSILPKKVLREKMSKLIENDFSKPNISSTLKLFKTFSDNECVTAVIAILKYVSLQLTANKNGSNETAPSSSKDFCQNSSKRRTGFGHEGYECSQKHPPADSRTAASTGGADEALFCSE